MQVVLAELNEEFQRFYGVQITNRTGVNTGEIVANPDPTADQNLATGDAVNVAARLEQSAPAGEVLIGEVTHELCSTTSRSSGSLLTLKGKPEPVPAYRLVGVRESAAPVDTDTALLGRDREVRRLGATYDEVVAAGRPRLLTVTGEAGLGKSRLIADFVADASARGHGDARPLPGLRRRHHVLAARRDRPQRRRRIVEDDSTDEARAKIAALLPAADPDREAVVDRVVSGDRPVGAATSR